MKALESSTFQKRPAYQYIRQTDKLPTIAQAIAREEADDFAGHIAKVKLFNPTGSQTWYVLAYDPDTRDAYVLADLYGNIREAEYGDINMAELVDLRGRFGLPIERDLHWTPKSSHEIKKGG